MGVWVAWPPRESLVGAGGGPRAAAVLDCWAVRPVHASHAVVFTSLGPLAYRKRQKRKTSHARRRKRKSSSSRAARSFPSHPSAPFRFFELFPFLRLSPDSVAAPPPLRRLAAAQEPCRASGRSGASPTAASSGSPRPTRLPPRPRRPRRRRCRLWTRRRVRLILPLLTRRRPAARQSKVRSPSPYTPLH